MDVRIMQQCRNLQQDVCWQAGPAGQVPHALGPAGPLKTPPRWPCCESNLHRNTSCAIRLLTRQAQPTHALMLTGLCCHALDAASRKQLATACRITGQTREPNTRIQVPVSGSAAACGAPRPLKVASPGAHIPSVIEY
jgi:hypothetical protein